MGESNIGSLRVERVSLSGAAAVLSVGVRKIKPGSVRSADPEQSRPHGCAEPISPTRVADPTVLPSERW
jgi:hypothetical protein